MVPDRHIEEDSLPLIRPDGTIMSLAEIEEAVVDFALCRISSVTDAARVLGIGRSTIYRYMDRMK